MAMDQDLRPRFFEDQYLGADDLNLVSEHGRVHAARHALGAHTWGIALGLELREKQRANGDIDVFVSPGYAWDGFGRPIVVLESAPVSASFFQTFPFLPGVDDGTPEGRLFAVWVRYEEQATQGPLPGFESCGSEGQQRRVQESFQLEVTVYQPPSPPPMVGQQDNILVDGTSIPAEDALSVPPSSPPPVPRNIVDGSIPFQIFPPADERKRWLIPLGLVRWKPKVQNQAGRFISRNVDDKEQSLKVRRYIGVVAESVQAADGHIRMKARTNPNSSLWSNDLVWVEGKLRIEGDTRLLGGALHFRNSVDDANNFPVNIQRRETATGKTLQIAIGKESQGTNRLSIGPINGNVVDEKVVILDNGKVGIGTTTPSEMLTFMSSPGGPRLEITQTSSTLPWKTDGTINDGAFVINQQSNGSSKPDADFALMRDRKQRVILGDTDTYLSGQDRGAQKGRLRFFLNREEAGEKEVMHINDLGNVGIGTSAPTGLLSLQGPVSQHGLMTFFSPTADFEYDGGDDKLFVFRNINADGKTAFMGGNVGIGTPQPNVALAIRGDGINVYATDAWVENNMHVQGNEALTQGGRGRMRLGTAWQYVGVYAEQSSTGADNDLVLGASSGQVRIGYDGSRQVLRTDILRLGNKWRMSGVGDAHNDDDWLRLFDVNNSGYYGGLAAGKLWSSSGSLIGSDARLKEKVTDLTEATRKLTSLRGVSFYWKNRQLSQSRQLGLIAQEVEAIVPEVVEVGPDNMKGVKYSGLIALIIEVIKEQQGVIQQVRKDIQAFAKFKAKDKSKEKSSGA